MDSENFEKQANKYDIKTFKQQEIFNEQNTLFVQNILFGKVPEKLSQTLITSIEESAFLAYYYTLRILAKHQLNYFYSK